MDSNEESPLRYARVESTRKASAGTPLLGTELPTSHVPSSPRSENPVCQGKASLLSCVVNLANGAVGAGLLAFPSAFASTGVVLGPVITIACALIMGYTLTVLSESSRLASAFTYQGTVRQVVGKGWSIAAQIILFLYLFGGCTGFLAIIFDMVYSVTSVFVGKESFVSQRYFIIPLSAAVLVFPVCCVRTVGPLAKFSMVAVLCCLYAAGDVVVRGAMYISTNGVNENVTLVASSAVSVFEAVPIVVFALQCHAMSVQIFAELKHRTAGRETATIVGALAICVFIYIAVGVCGYLTFGSGVDDDILSAYSIKLIDVDIAKIGLALTAIFSYPINYIPARDAILDALRPLLKRRMNLLASAAEHEAFAGEGINTPVKKDWDTVAPVDLVTTPQRVLLTLCFVIATGALAVGVPSLSTVFGFTGSTAGVALIFLIPAVIMWKMATSLRNEWYGLERRSGRGPPSFSAYIEASPKAALEERKGRCSSRIRSQVVGAAIGLLGVVILVASLYSLILKAASGGRTLNETSSSF